METQQEGQHLYWQDKTFTSQKYMELTQLLVYQQFTVIQHINLLQQIMKQNKKRAASQPMDNQTDMQQEIDSKGGGLAGLPLGIQTNMALPMTNDDERMLIHGMLYGGPDHTRSSLDNNSNLNNHSKTAATTNYLTSNAGKNSVSSKQGPLMNRSATSENCISAVNKENDSGFVHTGSVNSAAISTVQRPASGIDHVFKHPLSSNNVDMLDQQMLAPNAGYENTPSYHNRHASHHYGGGIGHPPGSASNQNRPSNIRDMSSSSATNLMKQPVAMPGVISSNSINMTNILMSAGQYASQAVSNTQHHIPIRNTTTAGQLLLQGASGIGGSSILINRGSSQQSNHQPQMVMVSSQSNLSQQQIQQQQYKTAKTQMYEKMILSQQTPQVSTANPHHDKKALMFATAGNTFNTTSQIGGNSFQTQQQQFIQNQTISQQAHLGQMNGPSSLIFPRIANVRNENTANVGGVTIYKTNQGSSSQGPQGSMSQYHLQQNSNQSNQNSNLQSPFVQSGKAAAILMPSPGQPIIAGVQVTNYSIVKKKTVSPRNQANTSGYLSSQTAAANAPKMLLMADKNQHLLELAQGKPQISEDFKGSIVTSSDLQDSNSKNKNRLKNNHYNLPNSKNGPEITDTTDNNGMLAKYNSGAVIEDSIQKAPISGPANQFFCGEMSLNGDAGRRMAAEDSSTLFQNNVITPSIMSSQSNKRQSHHLGLYNPAQQAIIQQQQQRQGQAPAEQQPPQQQSLNFFSRRTVSHKDPQGASSSFKNQMPGMNQVSSMQQHDYMNQHSDPQHFSQTTYPFSPTGGQGVSGGTMSSLAAANGQQRIMTSEGEQRLKYTGSVNGHRSSHDQSPSKMDVQQIVSSTSATDQTGLQTTLVNGEQQPVKIPVICGFHKRVLLLTSQIQNQAANGIGGPPLAGSQSQPQRESITKKIRNRNPNCNHNNNSVFYAPCYNNVKYDDSYKKKEEVLRKVFFKECAREDEKRTFSQQQYYPPSANPQNQLTNKGDPFSYLKPIENFLIQTLFVDYDIQQANKVNPSSVPLRVPVATTTLFMDLGLETAIVAHKAFLLALIQSGKITNENMLKVLHEFKSSSQEFDHECIYCKYSQYALRESTKVIRNTLKSQIAGESSGPTNTTTITEGDTIKHGLAADLAGNASPSKDGQTPGQEPRIEYLIRMFQSQLFKRSFINTSLMIIQRKMNEKLLQKQRLPPGIGQQNAGGVVLDANGKPKKPTKPNQGKSTQPMSSLDWLAAQIQKLAKNLSNPKDKDKYLELKEKYYREFLLKINLSNNAIIPFPKATFTPYKYYIGKGNNSILVRNCLKARFWWSMGDFEDWDEYNFIWSQWKANKIVAKIKTNKEMLALDENGHPSGKTGLSAKDGGPIATSDSMLSTDRDSNSSAETLLATPTKRKRVATAILITSQNSAIGIKKNVSASKQIMLAGKPGQPAGVTASTPAGVPVEEKEKKETSHHIITYNHMENNYHLSNKKALYYNMKIYYESIGQDWFNVLPLTFHIKEGPSDKEFQKFMEIFKDYDSGKSQGAYEKLGKQIWIVKPGENTNRGCGIQVCRELPQIKEIISNTNVNGQKRSYIIQKYIEKPLLYKNRKFDIRCYTLLTTVNGNLQGYWYNEGYLRTSSKDFNLKNVTNRLIHLTNDAVQKKSDDYGKFECGNKLSYPDFQKYLDSIDVKCNIVKEIVPQLKKIATDTIKACSRKVDPHRRHNTFEIFGYDFMIDEEMKPWLIEVNTNPCLELSAPYLSRLIPTMIENAVKIAVDPLFPPPPWPNAKKHLLPDCIDNNKFDLVFNELTDGAELRNLPIDDIAMNGIIEEEEMEDEGDDNDGDEEEIN